MAANSYSKLFHLYCFDFGTRGRLVVFIIVVLSNVVNPLEVIPELNLLVLTPEIIDILSVGHV